MSGKNTVCLVEVLITADLPTLAASRSTLAPSSLASASASMSSNSTTLPTRYGNCLLFLIFSLLSSIFCTMAIFSCCKRRSSDRNKRISFSIIFVRLTRSPVDEFRISWSISNSGSFSSSSSVDIMIYKMKILFLCHPEMDARRSTFYDVDGVDILQLTSIRCILLTRKDYTITPR
ncbi:hypothetical protein OGAPHI_001491 [Ogataea philodendri]|uniref:Uncharacterized protein n=1 Tax=Ogataea philodendri TaxID=1378263 RepID=A0A9P8PD25_9ASCO|nr:uncharacterized protein OGAPHI_001491 [Ogataea philodendri]KAH3669370.1 hypothetical protein OGAPHI_001491 [Ogataea philodendri]